MHDATTDPARIRALFAAAPWATGYGIACAPPPHHLIGIDLDTTSDTKSDTDSDTDSASALRELALRRLFTIPPTVVVLTPSSGRHLWLTGPPDVVVPNSASRLAPGIGIWGAGGYLVGPGSRTAHGVYATAPGTTHLTPAPCPRSLLRLPLPPPRSPHAGRPDTGVGFEPTVTSLPRRFSRSLGGRGAGTLRSRSDGYEHACGPVIIVIVPATCPRLMVVPAQPGVGRFGNLVVATGDRSGVVPVVTLAVEWPSRWAAVMTPYRSATQVPCEARRSCGVTSVSPAAETAGSK